MHKAVGLQKKLINYSIILLLVVLSCTGISSYNVSKQIIIDNVYRMNSVSMKEAIERTNTAFNVIENIFNIISNEAIVNKPVNEAGLTAAEVALDHQAKNKYLSLLIKDYDVIDSIYVVIDNNIYSAGNIIVAGKGVNPFEQPENARKDLAEMKKLNSGNEKLYFGCLNKQTIVFQNLKINPNNYIVVLLKKNIQDKLRYPGENVYISNGNINLRISTELNANMEHGKIAGIDPEKIRSLGNESIFGELICLKGNLSINGWQVINFIDIRNILDGIRVIMILVIVVALISFVAVLLLSFFFTRRFTNSITSLKDHIEDIHERNTYEQIQLKTKEFKIPRPTIPISFRNRILIYFILVGIIPAICISSIAYIRTIVFIEKSISGAMEQNIKHVSSQIDFSLGNYLQSCISISTNQFLQNYLVQYYSFEKQSIENRQKEISDKVLNEIAYNKNIVNISIYNEKIMPIYYMTYNESISNVNKYQDEFEELRKRPWINLWSGILTDYFDNSFLRIGMRIRDVRRGTSLGYLYLDFSSYNMDNLLHSIPNESKIGVFLLQDNGDVIYSNQSSPEYLDIAKLYRKRAASEGILKIGRNRTQYYITGNTLDTNNWKMITVIPVKEYINESNTILKYNATLLLLYIVIIIFMSLRFSSSITKSIKGLQGAMLEVQNANFNEVKIIKSNDEIEELSSNFNIMIRKIRSLIDEVYVAEIEKNEARLKLKEAQFNAFQAQINPHFLYNTLDTVQYMIILEDQRAVEVVHLLGDLFRIGIGKGEKFVNVQQEIDHINLYIQIQQIRYANKFKVIYNLQDEILNLYTVKFLLQPIIENAIYHGMELVEEGGAIEINGRLEAGKLVVQVIDNGRGMTVQDVDALIERLDGKKKSRSIGLKNVHERIRLYFGDEYGVNVNSILGKGTEISLNLPIIKEKPE
jgi:two-component system sensor histidine kinase YesM